MKRELKSDRAPKPVGPYSQGLETDHFVYCSGQVGADPSTGALAEGIVAQTARALGNLEQVLSSASMSLADVVKTTVFMVDLAEFGPMNEEYAKHFMAPFPTRSTVQAAALPKGARVEIEAVAVKRD
ncbi:MAG TPA: Rid family detoxifying hydrolase [Nitrososphaerales archaeon]|nr:Rid family detoxifying hydrolase [Nitrososphaerales archaeon]